MTPTNHLDVLKELRDETRWGFITREEPINKRGDKVCEMCNAIPCRTPTQIAALTHVIKQQESLADAEGHAAVLLKLANIWRSSSNPALHEDSIASCNAGALALTERPALMAELTTAREQIAGLEREQAKDAVEWADLCLAHKKEAEAARTALAEKEAELAVFHERSRKSGDVMYWIAEHDVEHAKVLSLEAENTRLRAALQGVREAIAVNGHTYHEPDWNPDAHVEITLTVAEVRLVRNAFDD